MAYIEIDIDIQLALNQLLNARVENGTGFSSGGAGSIGRLMFDDVSFRFLYDDGTNIQTVANLNDVAGLLDFKGGYNATLNVPDLISGTGIYKGDYYIVTVAGTFYGTLVEVGDSLFANIDTPITLGDWTLIQGNIVYASETVAGVIRISTQAETDAGIDDLEAITPLKLKTASFVAKKYISPSTSVGSGVAVTITHNLNNTKPVVNIVRDSTGGTIILLLNNFTANSFDVIKNGSNYNVTIGVIG